MKPEKKILSLKTNLITKIPPAFMLGSDKIKWNVFSKAYFIGFLKTHSLINIKTVISNFSKVLAFALKMSQQMYYSPLAVDTLQEVFRGEFLKKMCDDYQIGIIIRCRKAILPGIYSRISFLKKNWLLGKMIKRADQYNNKTFLHIKNSINLVFVLNTDKCKYIIKDAFKFGVPFIALIGGDNNTSRITYPIPGNGRDIKSVRFFVELISEAKIQGLKDRKKLEAKFLKIIN